MRFQETEVGRGWARVKRRRRRYEWGVGEEEEDWEVVLVVVCSRGGENISVFYGHISGGIIKSLASRALMC